MAFDPIGIAEEFFEAVRRVRALGAGTPETAYYPALHTLFERVGASLSPRVLALSQLANTGAGSPDYGLFASSQVQRGEPRSGQMPERGVVEVKPVTDDAMFKSTPAQLSKYFAAYGLVLVTNLRSFQLVGRGANGQAIRLEAFTLAEKPTDFWNLVQTPAASAHAMGPPFVEYLRRALTHNVALVQPKDVAWFLASYARDALARVDAAGDLPALKSIRSALEDALGITFEGGKGEHFFRSTLVQTLFYGLFSAWVIWARSTPAPGDRFDWRSAGWTLHVPFVSALFQQLTAPRSIKQLDLVEVLDWTGATLNRIDATEFLERFEEGKAVQYFYEPFLEAFDPQLRKQFGVWYTPGEVVDYMVARVDRALKDELGIVDGLADERVYVLDPCCGTGGFFNAVLRRIHANLETHGLGSALADRLRKAATERVFGFEIMPAPFVVAHMQAGITLTQMQASLAADTRPAIYLTNALTGWEPHTDKPLPFAELEEERASANAVKQTKPILVVLGNPPYDGYAGVADNAEERALSEEYRRVDKVAPPQGQGLNELYVRFFRMAERRIAEKTGEGVVAFISNYGWLDSMSCTGMRERYLDAFDSVSIDCLNGDKFKTGKKTPEGLPDPSIFSVPSNPVGIQVGTAIATMVRKREHQPSGEIGFRHLWGSHKRRTLADTAETDRETLYETITPSLSMRLQFMPSDVGASYFEWPSLTDLLPVGFPGVKTSRDEFLVDIDRDALETRIGHYFDPKISDADIAKAYPTIAKTSSSFSGLKARSSLMRRRQLEVQRAQRTGEPAAHAGGIIPYAYRPFDARWVYWDPDERLLDRERAEFRAHALAGAVLIEAREKEVGDIFTRGAITSGLADNFGNGLSTFFPAMLDDGRGELERLNLRQTTDLWRQTLGLEGTDIFYHCVATIHAPAYRRNFDDALRTGWPRIPLPRNADALRASSALGVQISHLLDVDVPVAGVSTGALKAGLSAIGLPEGRDYDLSLGWGHLQTNKTGSRIVMPGSGRTVERAWTDTERRQLDTLAGRHEIDPAVLLALIGDTAIDVHMNAESKWTGVPSKVWEYELGGHRVLKKWLSYRERDILGRALTGEEAMHFARSARRITEVLCMGPSLDATHALAREDAIPWSEVTQGAQS